MTILDKIIAEKYREVETQKTLVTTKSLEKRVGFTKSVLSMKKAITSNGSSGIIAEFKRRSPSKGTLNNKIRVEDVTAGYASAGAAGLSVLTDRPFFGGSPVDLIAAKELNNIPILRKDFIVDEYQILESKAMGADVILIIASVLDADQIKKFSSLAKSLGMEILFEIHSIEELDKIDLNIDMIGVNNRDLKDFKVDIGNSIELAKYITENFIKVSESGLDNPDKIMQLRNYGYHGFLIGESFMKHEDPGFACREFIEKLNG